MKSNTTIGIVLGFAAFAILFAFLSSIGVGGKLTSSLSIVVLACQLCFACIALTQSLKGNDESVIDEENAGPEIEVAPGESVKVINHKSENNDDPEFDEASLVLAFKTCLVEALSRYGATLKTDSNWASMIVTIPTCRDKNGKLWWNETKIELGCLVEHNRKGETHD